MRKPPREVRSVTLIEPTFNGVEHLACNLGLLRIVRLAFPDATIHYVGGREQITQIMEGAGQPSIQGVRFVEWSPQMDDDTMPGDVIKSWRRLRGLPREVTWGADVILLCSATATMVAAFCWGRLAARTYLMLHGNVHDLEGWQSRHPLRRLHNFAHALPRFCARGGQVLVLERRIGERLVASYPWLAGRWHCLPHPILAEEAGLAQPHAATRRCIRIGFAGFTRKDKGFHEFIALAHKLTHARPGQFEFHAIGRLLPESAELDQSVLATKAGDSLPRAAFVQGLRQLDYLFVWQHEDYYAQAASGVVYDAVNLGLPILGKPCGQVSAWQDEGFDVGMAFDDLTAATQTLADLDFDSPRERERYMAQCAHLARIREQLSPDHLAQTFRQLVSQPH
jgi:hypothetical protein